MDATRFPYCAYVISSDDMTVCGDQGVDLYRYVLYVCDYHRWRLESEARSIAEKHYEWIERERSEDWMSQKWREDRARTEGGRHVYYMACGEYIKIGVAENPIERLATIRRRGGVLAPKGLDLSEAKILATEVGGISIEREKHEQFAASRSVGEWFTRTPELDQYIDSLRGRRGLRVVGE